MLVGQAGEAKPWHNWIVLHVVLPPVEAGFCRSGIDAGFQQYESLEVRVSATPVILVLVPIHELEKGGVGEHHGHTELRYWQAFLFYNAGYG